MTPPALPCNSGQLVWRRHAGRSAPSRHAIRATCTQLLPLVEMYCRWVLQEDCSNLRTLMLRFDSEAQLETDVLGRALLLMVRDDDDGLEMYTRRLQVDAPVNPFEAILSRLSAVDIAFQGLQAQVHLDAVSSPNCTVSGMPVQALAMAEMFFSALMSITTLQFTQFLHILFCPPCGVVLCFASPLPSHLFPSAMLSLRFTLLLLLSGISKFCDSLLRCSFRTPRPPRCLWMPLAVCTSCSGVRFFHRRYH